MNIFSKKIKKYTLFSLLIFSIFAVLGVAFNWARPEDADLLFSQIEQEFSFIRDFNFIQTFLFIFVNNAFVITLAVFLGVLFAFIPLLFLAVNGFVLGLVGAYVYPILGLEGLILSLAPHGIFELTAFFIASGMGIYMGLLTISEIKEGRLSIKKVLKKIRRLKFPNKNIKDAYKVIFSVYLKIIIPLLFLAAVIEALLIFML